MLSLVRSNLVGQVGFVRDVRRLNVACTRARRHLCLITDSSTTSRAISGLIEYIEQHGEVRSAHQYLSEIEKLPVEDVHQKFELITKRPKAMKSEKLSENKLPSENKKEIADRIIATLTKWSISKECSLAKEFPATLTAFERSIVHKWAEEKGFNHFSVGENSDRRIIVEKRSSDFSLAEGQETRTVDDSSNVIEPDLPNERKIDAAELLIPPFQNVALPCAEASKKKSKKKKCKKLDQKKLENPKQEISNYSAAVTHSDVKCDICQKLVPQQNLTLHKLRCSVTEPAPKPKQKLLLKSLPTVDDKTEKEDVDTILSEFKKVDNICNLRLCKTNISLIGQLCSLCHRRFCLSHHLPEVHGCGDAAREQARAMTVKQGFVSSGSMPFKTKALDPNKRAHLQRSLDSKIEAAKIKRVGMNEDKKKKK